MNSIKTITFYSFLLTATISSSLCQETTTEGSSYTPIVMWHGMGDTCCLSFSLGAIKEKLETALPGVYVHSLRLGDNIIEDFESGFFVKPDEQIDYACELIRNDSNLANGFNAIGFSQGGQFLRGLVQRCDGINMKNLISVGGQHQGVYGFPNCVNFDYKICEDLRILLSKFAYEPRIQDFLVQATYWHDPIHEEKYKNGSHFLADINNEVTINQKYIDNLQSLEAFVMIKFNQDKMVAPVESEWFGFYEPGQSSVVQSLNVSAIYTDDRLGLYQMDMDNKLHYYAVEGDHLQFEWSWFEENIIENFLKN